MDITEKATRLWSFKGFKDRASHLFREYANKNNQDIFPEIDSTPLVTFATIEWLSAHLYKNFANRDWFYIEGNERLTKELQNNLELTGFYNNIKKAIKHFLITGAFFLVRYKEVNREFTQRVIVNDEELEKLKYKEDIEILSKEKISKEPVLFKVELKHYVNKILTELTPISPFRIEFSEDMKEFVRQVFLSEEEARNYGRKVWQLWREKTDGDSKYIEALEYYDDKGYVYLIIDNEIYYKEKLPTNRAPIVYAVPIKTAGLGYTVAEIMQDIQRLETLYQKAFFKNVKDFADYKIIYNPTVINRKELEGDNRLIQLKNPDITPEQAILFINKAQNIMPAELQGIEFLRGEKENITGFTRYNQGIAVGANNKTATGISLLFQAGQQRILDYLTSLLNALEEALRIMAVYQASLWGERFDVEDIVLKIKMESLEAVRQEKLQKLLQVAQIAPQALKADKLLNKLMELQNISEFKDIINPGGESVGT
jgi:hypothetical protein